MIVLVSVIRSATLVDHPSTQSSILIRPQAKRHEAGVRNFFLRLFRAAAVFDFLHVPDLPGLGYGNGLGFWVVFTIIVSRHLCSIRTHLV